MMIVIILSTITLVVICFAVVLVQQYRDKAEHERTEFFYGAVEKIKGFMLDLVFDAEKIYQSGTGQFKKSYVINMILNGEFYKGLPFVIQKLITFRVLSDLVDNVVGSVFNVVKESNKELQNRLVQ